MTMCNNCICADCVRNPYYAVNTPKPCVGADCDICRNGDMACWGCNQHLTLDEVNKMIAENRS